MTPLLRATTIPVALALTLLLAGCGDDSDADQSPVSESGSASATAPSGAEPSDGSDSSSEAEGEIGSETDGDDEAEESAGGEPSDDSETQESSPSLVPSSVTVEPFCDKIDAADLSDILGVSVPQFSTSSYVQKGITAESCSVVLEADGEGGAVFLEVRTGKDAVPRNVTAFQEKPRGVSDGVDLTTVPGVAAKKAAVVTLAKPPFSSVYVAVGDAIFECGIGVPATVTQPSADDVAVTCLGILNEIAS